MDDWIAALQHISVHPRLIQDRDPLLIEKAVFQAETGDQSGAFNTYLRHGPEVNISEMRYSWRKLVIFQ
jgi:hypothetical protein